MFEQCLSDASWSMGLAEVTGSLRRKRIVRLGSRTDVRELLLQASMLAALCNALSTGMGEGCIEQSVPAVAGEAEVA